jgi:hypothetical protein
MIEITQEEARRLVVSGEAGYWSIHFKTVVLEHDEKTVIRLQKKWFLATVPEIKISFCGQVGVLAGKTKGAFSVEIESQEIQDMATKEMSERANPLIKKVN